MKPQDFLKEAYRLCDSIDEKNGDCDNCPMAKAFCVHEIGDSSPEEFAAMYDVVEKWSDEHPVKTRQSEFLKLFPNSGVISGVLLVCPSTIDWDVGCRDTCSECRREYWLAPIDEIPKCGAKMDKRSSKLGGTDAAKKSTT